MEIYEAQAGDPNTTFPLPQAKGVPVGPCQLVPGRDKDRICKGLRWKANLLDYMKCCVRILCLCLSRSGDLVKECGTKGSGAHRTGVWQVINQSESHLWMKFKCCLAKDEGIRNPTSKVPRVGGKKGPKAGRRPET